MTDLGSRKLYDLAGADEERRFSPYCWRVRLALEHKNLAYETLPWRFTEKERLRQSNGETVPVLEDGDTIIRDSWEILQYLENTYPEKPLFPSLNSRGLSSFIRHWTESELHPIMMKIVILDIHKIIHPKDKDYFRQSRELRFGTTLEKLGANSEESISKFRSIIEPLRRNLSSDLFIEGSVPGCADYIVFSSFQWVRCVSPMMLIAEDDPIFTWRERMLDLFDGIARSVPSF